VNPGEAVGIHPHQRAGKSTLLKMIHWYHATLAECTITGRVAAMLELGMGFHPDFPAVPNGSSMAGTSSFGYGVDEIPI